MLPRRPRAVFPAVPLRVSAAWTLLGLAGAVRAAEPTHEEFFEKKIRPLLAENCFKCHGEEKQKGGLRLDSRAEALLGGDLGPAFVPGQAEQSRLIEAVRYTNEDLQMPPKKRLAAQEVADLTRWIELGAPWPGADANQRRDPVATKAVARGEIVFTPEQSQHWAWQPLQKPAVPRSKNDAWARTDIDRFILAKLEAAGLQPAPPAEPATFLRRLTFDLTGLPPTPGEIQTFSAESIRDPQSAIRNSTARLLASSHYGERYARHWLDVARYADSNGSEVDHAMANAWRYRDYVVRAFNDDKPFDRFVREQLAGDLLPGANTHTFAATGFLMLGPKALADLDKPKLAADIIDEQVDTVTRAFMGVTLACARCHDHKFDPLPTADYYALAGIFKSTRTMVDLTRRVAPGTSARLTPRTHRASPNSPNASPISRRSAISRAPAAPCPHCPRAVSSSSSRPRTSRVATCASMTISSDAASASSAPARSIPTASNTSSIFPRRVVTSSSCATPPRNRGPRNSPSTATSKR